jgi:hypothetical protein
MQKQIDLYRQVGECPGLRKHALREQYPRIAESEFIQTVIVERVVTTEIIPLKKGKRISKASKTRTWSSGFERGLIAFRFKKTASEVRPWTGQTVS